jgi:hypothetical protein
VSDGQWAPRRLLRAPARREQGPRRGRWREPPPQSRRVALPGLTRPKPWSSLHRRPSRDRNSTGFASRRQPACTSPLPRAAYLASRSMVQPFRSQNSRWYPWFQRGSSKWAIQKDFFHHRSGPRVRITHDGPDGVSLFQNWFFHCLNAANTPAGSLTRLPRYLFADSTTAGRVTRKNGLVAFSRPIVEGRVGRLSRLA